MEKKLNIAFVWHMHQPFYKDPLTGEYTLPWVLFHGTKDYYDMGAILEEFPSIHQTINVVPCLLEQLREYGSGNARDRYRIASQKKAALLSKEDKTFILQYFFQANWENMIRPVPRYWELLRKRGVSSSEEDIRPVLRYFTEQDYLDLQVLFNLVWIDPWVRSSDPFLSDLMKRGAGFTEAEKAKLMDKQIEIVNLIIPKYSELREKGILELSTTPYYHPILPLLCDSFSAKEAIPDIVLPKERFVHPEDAMAQVMKGVAYFKEVFGFSPVGMWPSEGSVSMDMLGPVLDAGIKWLATDEEILSNSLRRPIRRDSHGNCYDSFLYKPYSIEIDNQPISFIFRDHVLSDLIGFDYSKMYPEDAARDLVGRLMKIHNLVEDPENHLVSIILDGENAWESFKNDGRDFFVSLYSALTEHPKLRCVTVSEYLSRHKPKEKLDRIFPGSWINHNFKIWIGHCEDNTAWDYIAEARSALVKYEEAVKKTPEYTKKKDSIKEAWEALYAAEGSDWFWWYGEEHSTMLDEHFDNLFRLYIKQVYTLIETEPPEYLDLPITTEAKGYRPGIPTTAYINPVIDGEVSNYFEWLSAGKIEKQSYSGAMHQELQTGGFIEGIAYGFSKERLFFRFDYIKEPPRFEWSFSVNFLHPEHVKIVAEVFGKVSKASVFKRPGGKDKWTTEGELKEIASDMVVEIAIPLEKLGAETGDELKLFISIDAGENGMERWPVKGFLLLDVPTEDFEQQDWIV